MLQSDREELKLREQASHALMFVKLQSDREELKLEYRASEGGAQVRFNRTVRN